MDDCTALRYSPAVDEQPDSTMRVDAAALRSPQTQADGSVRFDALSSIEGAPLVYPWGTEVATREALSDPEYLSALVGLALTIHHPASGEHRIDEDERTDATEAGRIIGARFAEGVEMRRADGSAYRVNGVITTYAVARKDAIRRIRSGELGYVSEGYSVPHLVRRADGVSEQRKRIPQHHALTDSPRAAGAAIRTDEVSMTPDEIKAAVRAAITEQRADEADAKVVAATQRADEAIASRDAVLSALGLKADATPAQVEAAVASRADAITAIRRRADELGVQLPAAGSLADLTRALARGLPRVDSARCDDLAYAQAVIDLATAPTRTDSTPAPRLAV